MKTLAWGPNTYEIEEEIVEEREEKT